MQTNPLSKREWEVVQLLLQGKSNKLIAAALDISERTVEFHLKNIYTKYRVSTRVELILKLGNSTGGIEIKKPGYSTVDNSSKTVENGDRFDSQKNWIVSPTSERNGTMNANIRKILQNALTGFVPSVFLFMAITVLLDGIRFFKHNQNWEAFIQGSIQNQNFLAVFTLELLLLTGGYIFTTLVFNSKYLSFAWWRSAVAGVGAVILLALLSILIQPASLFTIVLASVSTGGISVLFMLHKTPQTLSN